MSYYREQLEEWLKRISIKTERVLDLGGASNPVIKRLKSFDAEEYICFDSGAEEAKIQYINFDINKPLEQLEGFTEDAFKFDAIFCLEVFEYVWDPVEAMRNIARLLNGDGLAYISFPAIYPVHNPVEIDSLRYTKQVIEKYCKIFNLKILELKPRVATLGQASLSNFYSAEGMHPVRKSALPFDIGYLLKVAKRY